MKSILFRIVAALLVLVVSGTVQPLLAQQNAPTQSQTGQTQNQPVDQNPLPPLELPENPGRNTSQPATLPNAPTSQPAPSTTPATPAQGASPSGTAVAPPVQVSGGAASKPAGVAIAPPKQRQVRSLLLKLGLLAGAGIAVGTVVGLSAASPGHVPNSPGH
ncbi:MAG TPA: hypothetical protein VGL74_05545 [Terriglobales bacterium]